MIIAASIAVGIGLALLMYRLLFDDFGEFIHAVDLVISQRGWPLPRQEDIEDDGWTIGFRFYLFMIVSVGGAFVAFHLLEKHFQ